MNGYCLYGQPPVLLPPPSGNPSWDAWQASCAVAKAEAEAKAAAVKAEILRLNGYGPAAVTVPTREQRIAALRREIAATEQSIRSRDIAQTWGRLTSAEYCLRTHADMRRAADLRAMLADAEGGAL